MGGCGLFFQADAKQAVLPPHIEAAITQGHRTPEFKIFFAGEIRAEDVGLGEKLEALRAWFDQAESALFSVLDDEHAIRIEASATSHEGIIARPPYFLPIEIPATQSASLALGCDPVVRVFVGEKVEVFVDNEGRMNLGSLLNGPFFTGFIAVRGFSQGKHLGSAVVATSHEDQLITNPGDDGNWDAVIVVTGLPEDTSVLRVIACCIAGGAFLGNEHDVGISANFENGGRGVGIADGATLSDLFAGLPVPACNPGFRPKGCYKDDVSYDECALGVAPLGRRGIGIAI